MAELKTQPTKASVARFIAGVEDVQRRADCEALNKLMQSVTGLKPEMWGPTIVGFGRYKYTYASGHSAEWPLAGFSPRKKDLTVYIMAGFEKFEELMGRLGKYKTGKSCLYLKRLSDVDQDVLAELVRASVQAMRERWG